MPSDEMWTRIAIAVDRPCPYPKGSRKRVQWYRFRQLAGVAIFHSGDSQETLARQVQPDYLPTGFSPASFFKPPVKLSLPKAKGRSNRNSWR